MRNLFYPFIFLLLLGLIPKTYATNFTVTDDISLITAINTANTNGQADVITLANDIDLSAVNNTTDGANGLPSILSDSGNSLTIEGAGYTISRIGAAGFRIMHIDINATVIINQLGIENGLANAGGLGTLGGGIYSAGDVTITESVFTGNAATGASGIGGAIFINLRDNPVRTFTLSNSTFTGNSAAFGGAIYNYQNNGTNLITGNTFSNNTAQFGGAIGDENSDTTLINNTISGNTATNSGGGIYRLGGTSLMQNNTLSNNTAATSGGGLYNWLGTVTFQNTLVAGNTGGECYLEPGGGNLVGNSYNLFGTSSSAGGCPAGATDIVPTGAIGTVLSALANNGGLTLTHALISTSPAIDAANNSNCPSIDQRGFLRGFDGDATLNSPELADCDIGAFEYSLDPAYASLPTVGATINLGSTPVGTEISTLLEIMEVGAAGLTVSLNSITGANAADFSIIGLPTIIGNGNPPQDVALICTPSASGLRTAQISFTTNDPAQPSVSYTLECTGTDSIVASASLLDINQVVTEGNLTVNVTVQLAVPLGYTNTGDVTVEVIDAATGNATSGTDYTAFPATTLTFTGPLTPGTTYTDTVNLNVDILDDSTLEGAEALALTINQVSANAEIGFPDTHTIVINDNDANTYAQASFVANSALINENAGTMSIDVQLFIPAAFNLTGDVTLTITDGLAGNATSGADYTAFAPVTLTFVDAPFVVGTTYTQTITLDILDDAIVEGAETVELAITGISGPVELVSPASFTAIINDDELTTRIITRDGETITVTNGGGTADTDFVFKTVDNPFATVGQTVIYTIRARNPKSIPLTQVVIYDVFDNRLTDIQLLSTSHGAGIFNANTLTVSGFTLQPNEEAVIVISARIASLRAGETIPNAAILESPNASVHVSNLALVGDNPTGNSGGAAQVFIVPSQLPSTGESPLWRYGVLVGVGCLLLLGVGGYWLQKKKA